MYTPSIVPVEYDPSWIQREFDHVTQALTAIDTIRLVELHVEPSRPRAGDVVLADGSDWDPGSGQGFYGYYAGAWHKLG